MVKNFNLTERTQAKKGKINISYFLPNKGAFEDDRTNEKYYPIYIKVVVKRQNTTFKSIALHNQYSTIDGFNDFLARNKRTIEREKITIEKIINKIRPFDDPHFKIETVFAIYSALHRNLLEYVEGKIKQVIIRVLIDKGFENLVKIIDPMSKPYEIFKGLRTFVDLPQLLLFYGYPHILTILYMYEDYLGYTHNLKNIYLINWLEGYIPSIFLNRDKPQYVEALNIIIFEDEEKF